MKDQLKEQLTFIIKEVLAEKKLTPAKLKKRNKNAEKIKKANPEMDKGEAFAIATKQLKEEKPTLLNYKTNDEFFQALDDADAKEILKSIYSELGKPVIDIAKKVIKKTAGFVGGPEVRDAIAKRDAEKGNLNEVEEDVVDTITMDVPLFIRMLEFAREDASTDMDLHDVAENAISLNKEKEFLSMEDYDSIIPSEVENLD
jgi:hypothetical protein